MKRILSFLIFAFVIFHCSAQTWDINLLKKVNGIDNSFVRGFSKGISKSEPFVALGVPCVMGVYALIDHNKQLLSDAFFVGTAVGEALFISYSMKLLTDRERPFSKYPNEINNREDVLSSSFPSAHVSSAFSLATSLSIRYPKWYVILPTYAWACSVGFSRMNIGVHYPSDVLAGAVIGTGCAVVNVYVNKWLKKNLFTSKKLKPLLY